MKKEKKAGRASLLATRKNGKKCLCDKALGRCGRRCRKKKKKKKGPTIATLSYREQSKVWKGKGRKAVNVILLSAFR